MSNSPKGWKPAGVAFCWQPKAALHRIRESLDADNAVASGLLVYLELTEIASDKQSPTFQTTHGYIAGRIGLSQRTVQQRIHDLKEIGVLKYAVEAGVRGPATYTLIEQPLPHVKQRIPNDEQPLPHVKQRSKNAPLPSYKESAEESEKNKAKNPIKPVALNHADLTPDGAVVVELMEQCKAVLGDDEMNRSECHRRWYERAMKQPGILRRVLASTRVAKVEGTIKTTPAQYAEQLWKEFK